MPGRTPVGLRAVALAALLAAAPVGAAADEIDDCEALGKTQLSESSFDRPFEIDREKLNFDKAEAEVGSQFVSSVLHGPANMDTGGEMESVRFICLHGGTDAGALFVWFLPD